MTNFVFAFRLNRQEIVDLGVYTPEEFMKAFRIEGTYEQFCNGGNLDDVIDFTSAEDALAYLDGDGEIRAGYEDFAEAWREEIRAHADREINPEDLSPKQRDEFVSGYEQAGGYMGDAESPAPWCAPWTHGTSEIVVAGPTAKDWGACWWRSNREEIESLLEEEAENEE